MAMGEVKPLPGARIDVRLSQSATVALAECQEREGLSKTDTVCRALLLYNWVEEHRAIGLDFGMYDPEDSEFQLLRIT